MTSTKPNRGQSPTANKHKLVIVNPGHFHAALSLHARHPQVSDEVHVYAEEGSEVDEFLAIVKSFNARSIRPTRWKITAYRGADYLDRLIAEKAGNIAIIAGQNHTKIATIHRLCEAGFHVLADKPLIIEEAGISLLRQVVSGSPLMFEIMTGRYEPANRVLKALVDDRDVFGGFRIDKAVPTIEMASVHHLHKTVNGAPLMRPPWFFDVRMQGEGMMDVTTHLIDLAQWLTCDGSPVGMAGDVELMAARQWPTKVPRATFARVTGHDKFPPSLRTEVAGDYLDLLCNAALECRLHGIPVSLESQWALRIPPGGGDTHRTVVRGTKATLIVERNHGTGFVDRLVVEPEEIAANFAVERAIAGLQNLFPGLGYVSKAGSTQIVIPDSLATTHDEHFAQVLDTFLGYIEKGTSLEILAQTIIAKYGLLVRARQASHASD